MAIAAELSGGVVIGIAIALVVVVVFLRRSRRPSVPRPDLPPTIVTLDSGSRTSSGDDWARIRESIVHGDPFLAECIAADRFTLCFANDAGRDALDVEIDFRHYAGDFRVDGAVYQHDRMVQGVAYPVAIRPTTGIQGRVPVWATYTIEGDPMAERHTIDVSVVLG